MQKKVQIVSDGSLDLPQEITDKTIAKYLQAYKMLTGEDLK